MSEEVKGLAEWVQSRAKTLRKRERYNERPTIATKVRFSRGSMQLLSKPPIYQSMFTRTNLALSPRKCSLCDGDHSEVTCPTLLAADLEKRRDIVKTRRSVLAVSNAVISAFNAFNPQNVERNHVEKGVTTFCTPLNLKRSRKCKSPRALSCRLRIVEFVAVKHR